MNSERQFAKDNWILHITYTLAGTRSEGQHGELSHNGRSQQPTHEGQELDTPLGRMKYYLHPDNATLPFEITGWNFADHSLIRPSTDTSFLENL